MPNFPDPTHDEGWEDEDGEPEEGNLSRFVAVRDAIGDLNFVNLRNSKETDNAEIIHASISATLRAGSRGKCDCPKPSNGV